MSQPTSTRPMVVVCTTVEVGSYGVARNRTNSYPVATQEDAAELAGKLSARYGHASVHQGAELLFSYADGELFTDNRSR